MRVVLALRTRDQADLVDALVAFHLNAGVDFVIATDHVSADGTAEILESYARAGVLRLLRDTGEKITLRRSEMADLAAAEHGADWVLHCDGDEFWWPRGGSVKEVLATVPERYGVVRAAWHHFAPRPDDGRYFAERMTVRVSPHAPPARQSDPFHAQVKVAHRASLGVTVTQGGHDAEGAGLRTLRSWFPFEVLHFPLRSLQQGRAKYELLRAGLSAGALDVSRHVERATRDIDAGRWEDTYATWLVDDAALELRLADGAVCMDTRLRDALRRLARVDELPADGARYARPPDAPTLRFSAVASAVEAASYAHDTQPLYALDAEMRLEGRVSALENRLARLGERR
jgi:Glycosyl transferase family 2